ncbi:alpha/beta-hydrolase [Xylariaceae sp. FL0255]|nr:alpha/beta-hydrolase [Xylariaceae sp. FL0255]
MISTLSFLSACTLVLRTVATPAPFLIELQERSNLDGILSSIENASDPSRIGSIISDVVPSPSPTSVEDAVSRLRSAYAAASPSGVFEAAAVIIDQGLASNDLASIFNGFNTRSYNNASNVNPRKPRERIFPKKKPVDAPYQQTEATLRRQIYIPSTFTYGEKPPVILIPGTGERGGNNFIGNLIPLLQSKPYADLVWINPINFQLDDVQLNAENVAYAINYISGISNNRNVSIIGWSQGSISMQLALKKWPSTRKIVSDQIAISADYHGTTVASLLDPIVDALPPSIMQQAYDSVFIRALRSDGGDSAYVPTTTIYSSFDEIVQPQQGVSASAIINDAHHVGVSNNQVQIMCPSGSPAGGFYTHESMLTNPLAFALIEDALTHPGPGTTSRLNLDSVCSTIITRGLTLEDFLLTEAAVPFAVYAIIEYFIKVAKGSLVQLSM